MIGRHHWSPIVPSRAQNWPKYNKTQWNDGFELKIGMGIFFGTRKPMVMSEFQNFKILTLFVTSLTTNYTQNSPKLTKNTIKHDEMIVLI